MISTKPLAVIAALLLATGAAACGADDETLPASQASPGAKAFCADHRGIDVAEADGDATCVDGTEYENPADIDVESSKPKSSKPKSSKPKSGAKKSTPRKSTRPARKR